VTLSNLFASTFSGYYGIPICERDLQIAAIALAGGFGVVTHNTKEFKSVQGLVVEDWS
jgi:tRNA(fMet)-specific endonuclease VapC